MTSTLNKVRSLNRAGRTLRQFSDELTLWALRAPGACRTPREAAWGDQHDYRYDSKAVTHAKSKASIIGGQHATRAKRWAQVRSKGHRFAPPRRVPTIFVVHDPDFGTEVYTDGVIDVLELDMGSGFDMGRGWLEPGELERMRETLSWCQSEAKKHDGKPEIALGFQNVIRRLSDGIARWGDDTPNTSEVTA